MTFNNISTIIILAFFVLSNSAYSSPVADKLLARSIQDDDWEAFQLALGLGANVDEIPFGTGSPLVEALKNGQRAMFAELLKRGANPNFQSETKGMTPLHTLANNDRSTPNMFKMLIEAGASVSEKAKHESLYEATPLGALIALGKSQKKKQQIAELLLLHNADPNGRDHSNFPFLLLAALVSDYNVMKALVGRPQIDLYARIGKNDTFWPMNTFELCLIKDDPTCVSILLSAGFKIQRQLANGFKPLEMAQSPKMKSLVKNALQRQSDEPKPPQRMSPHIETQVTGFMSTDDVNALSQFIYEGVPTVDSNGVFLVALAASANAPMTIEMLYRRGFSVDQGSPSGPSPLQYAACNCQLKAVKKLLELEANPNPLRNGLSTLHLVAADNTCKQAPQILDLIVKAGGDIDQPSFFESENANFPIDAHTPLMSACTLRNHANMESLIELGANIHFQNKHGKNALMMSVIQNDLKGVQILIGNGADVHAKTAEGLSSLQLATDWNIKMALIDAGAPIEELSTAERSRLATAQMFDQAAQALTPAFTLLTQTGAYIWSWFTFKTTAIVGIVTGIGIYVNKKISDAAKQAASAMRIKARIAKLQFSAFNAFAKKDSSSKAKPKTKGSSVGFNFYGSGSNAGAVGIVPRGKVKDSLNAEAKKRMNAIRQEQATAASDASSSSQSNRLEMLTSQEFQDWYDGLSDDHQLTVRRALEDIELGRPTNIRIFSGGKLREYKLGSGIRIYFCIKKGIVYLIDGGDKDTQDADIESSLEAIAEIVEAK